MNARGDGQYFLRARRESVGSRSGSRALALVAGLAQGDGKSRENGRDSFATRNVEEMSEILD